MFNGKVSGNENTIRTARYSNAGDRVNILTADGWLSLCAGEVKLLCDKLGLDYTTAEPEALVGKPVKISTSLRGNLYVDFR